MTEKNISSIESDIAVVRERLASTIDELVYRTSPKTIARREANQVKAFFIDEQGSPRQDNILKVAGGMVGVIVLLAVIRKIVK